MEMDEVFLRKGSVVGFSNSSCSLHNQVLYFTEYYLVLKKLQNDMYQKWVIPKFPSKDSLPLSMETVLEGYV